MLLSSFSAVVLCYLLCASFTIYCLRLVCSIFLNFTFSSIVWAVTLSYWIFSALHIRTHIALSWLYSFCFHSFCLLLSMTRYLLATNNGWMKKKMKLKKNTNVHTVELSGLSGVWEYPSHQYEYNDVVVDISNVL